MRLSVSALLGEILAVLIGSGLMIIDPWLSIFAGFCCSLLIFIPWFYLTPQVNFNPPVLTIDSPRSPSHPSSPSSRTISQRRYFGRGIQSLASKLRWLLMQWRLILLLSVMLLVSPGLYFFDFLIQYAARRFHWTWSKVSMDIAVTLLFQ